jgi:hypothetical protein
MDNQGESMRKIITLLLAAAIILPLSVNVSASEAFTTADALTILRASAGLIELTPEQVAKYDMNGDGRITSADALLILQAAAGLSGSVLQIIPSNSEVLAAINRNNEQFQLSIEIEADGCALSNLVAKESGYSYVMRSDMTLGIIPELIYPSHLNVEKVILRFEIADKYLDNELGIFTDNPEFVGIKRFNVFMWIEALNMSLPIETKFDVENNILYAEVNRLGTFALIDMEKWFQNLGVGVF